MECLLHAEPRQADTPFLDALISSIVSPFQPTLDFASSSPQEKIKYIKFWRETYETCENGDTRAEDKLAQIDQYFHGLDLWDPSKVLMLRYSLKDGQKQHKTIEMLCTELKQTGLTVDYMFSSAS